MCLFIWKAEPWREKKRDTDEHLPSTKFLLLGGPGVSQKLLKLHLGFYMNDSDSVRWGITYISRHLDRKQHQDLNPGPLTWNTSVRTGVQIPVPNTCPERILSHLSHAPYFVILLKPLYLFREVNNYFCNFYKERTTIPCQKQVDSKVSSGVHELLVSKEGGIQSNLTCSF